MGPEKWIGRLRRMESESESGAAADTPPLETLSFHGDEEIIEVVELDPGPPDPGENCRASDRGTGGAHPWPLTPASPPSPPLPTGHSYRPLSPFPPALPPHLVLRPGRGGGSPDASSGPSPHTPPSHHPLGPPFPHRLWPTPGPQTSPVLRPQCPLLPAASPPRRPRPGFTLSV